MGDDEDDFANDFDSVANEDGRIVVVVTNDADFSPMTLSMLRADDGQVQATMAPITSVNSSVEFLFSRQIDDSAAMRPASLTMHHAIGGCLNAQHTTLFPPSENTDPRIGPVRVSEWDRDIALGHIASSLRGLASEGVDENIPELSDDDARTQTARVVLTSIERLAKTFELRLDDAGERDGMLSFDAALADELEHIGEHGKIRAANVRNNARERFKNRDDLLAYFRTWLPDGFLERTPVGGLPYLRTLGRAAWFDVVQPKLEQASKRSALVATIPAFIANDLRNIAGAKRAELASPESSGSTRIYADGNATSLVLASLQSIQAISAARLVELASGSYFWPTLHWIAATVRDQEFDGVIDPHIIRVKGGKEGLRSAIGGSKDGGADGIWSVLSALHLLSSASEPGTGRMLTLIEQRRASPNGGRPITIVVIEVHLLMRPRAAKALGLHFPDWSLPIFDPGLVQTIGDHRTKGRQINAAQSLAQHIHDRRRDVASDGSFVLTKKEWIDLGNRAGLYDRSHASLRDRYLDSLFEPPPRQRPLAFGRSVGTEPMLVRVGPDRYRLGDSFAPEWSHFAEQGKMTLASSAAGKRSARKRAAQVERELTPRMPRRRR